MGGCLHSIQPQSRQGRERALSTRRERVSSLCEISRGPVPPLSYMEKGTQNPAWCGTRNSAQASSTAHTNSRGPGPTRQVSLLDHGGLPTPASPPDLSRCPGAGVQEFTPPQHSSLPDD